jgi:hypothetical protein
MFTLLKKNSFVKHLMQPIHEPEKNYYNIFTELRF